ncbi:MAG: hypothetical protein K0R24_105 [Gammaproteobacteria bacterium]|jgi:hypothetical protein|nr:hypothetical protein [Gammaproteobacteria bacterium]
MEYTPYKLHQEQSYCGYKTLIKHAVIKGSIGFFMGRS